MPNPTPGDVHVNRPLTNILIAFMQNPEGFVADQVFRSVPSDNQSNLYWKYDRSDWNRAAFRKRAPQTESAGGGWKTTTDSFYAHVWALHKDIDDQLRANQDAPINLDRDATNWLGGQALISREVTWATDFFAAGIWKGATGSAQDVAGVTSSPSQYQVVFWDDATSTPVEDIAAYADLQHLLTFLRPNTAVMGRQVWTKLKDHPDLVDRIKYSSTPGNPAIVTRQAVAALFELERVLVMDGVQVTSPENPTFEASMTAAFIGGKSMLLTHTPASVSILQPANGITFNWTGYLGAGAMGQRISKFRMEWIKSDRVEAEMAYVQKGVAFDMGTFFTPIVR